MQHYISDGIYGLMLAWITSENSTKQLECRHLDSIFFAGPYLLCYCVRGQPRLRLLSPTTLSSFSQPTLFSCPLPLPDAARFQVQKPFVWFRAKTDKGIVCLAGHPYSVTVCYPVILLSSNPIGCDSWICWLHLCRRVIPPTLHESPVTDGDTLIYELWEMWSIPSLPLLWGPLWPRVVEVVPIRASSMG